MIKKAVVIGGEFAGLSGAALLEKNEAVGGRTRLWNHNGYTFDMGPSWYPMPEVFDRFSPIYCFRQRFSGRAGGAGN